MAIFAMRKGTSPNPTVVTTINDATNNINFDCPTNPMFVSDAVSVATNHRMFSYISTDDSHTQNFIQQLQGSDSAGTEYSNLSNTEGYSIHCWDEFSQTGIQLNGISPISSQTYDYFVLIHSDDLLQHHFARITEIKQDEVLGDRFDFEPRLGKQIPKNAKFMVFRGPLKTETSIVALSAGIKPENITSGSSTYRYDKSYICARPLFYFFEDRLDKKNELNHETKYFIKYITSNSSTVTPNVGNAFITTTDFSKRIIDYSKYSIKADLVDKLRDLDDPTLNAITSNEGFTLPSNDFTDYDKCFFNARRDANDVYDQTDATTLALTGPYRYTHYSFSPEKANTNFALADFNVFESIGSKGGYAEVKLIDTQRILPSKIKKDDMLRIRHRLHSANLSEFFPLKATISSQSGVNFVFDTEYDLSTLLAEGDEIKIADRIYVIASTGSAIGSFSSNQQTIVMTSSTRLESSSTFSATSLTGIASSGDRLYRRAWSQSKGNLLTTFKIIENRHHNVKVLFNDLVEATVSSSNATTKTLSLSFDNSLYESESSIGFVSGIYSIEIERFEGTVEQMDNEREFGQNFMKLFGRSTFSKLISPIINKNYLHSKDIVYSSESPSKTAVICGTSNTVKFSLNTVVLATVTSAPEAGDDLYLGYNNENFSYIGRVQSYNSGSKTVTLETHSFASCEKLTVGTGLSAATLYVWKSSGKPYLFNKALSSNNRITETTTSLIGASEKGIFFESGLDISDNSTLIKTSKSTDDKAIGYHLHEVSKIDKDNEFQAELTDGASSVSYANFDTVNTLIDFTVVSQNTKDGKTTIELAPYVPVALGRMDFNDADVTDVDLVTVGSTVGSAAVGNNVRHVEIASISNTPSEKDPLYIAGSFVGYVVQVVKPSTSANWKIYVDRPIVHSASATVQALDDYSPYGSENYEEKYTQDLYLTNGAHLHGGKFVSLLHPLFLNNKAATFVTHTGQRSQNTTTTERYGTPQYRIMHLEKGVFDFVSRSITTSAQSFENNYYEGGSKIKYYASCYKVNPVRHYAGSVYYSGTIGRNFTGSNSNHLPIEARGNFPAAGSLFFDYDVYESGHTKPTIVDVTPPTVSTEITKSKYLVKDYLEQFDPKSRRLFLFSTSDLTPYSSTRSDSIFNMTFSAGIGRVGNIITEKDDLKKFKLMLLGEPTESAFSEGQSKYSSKGSTVKYTDETYINAGITEVDKDIVQLKRTGIMRLTELVFDTAFNQFNAEKPPKKTKQIPSFIYHYHTIAAVTDSGGSNVSVSGYGSSNITLSASATLSDNDLLVDSNGKMIGVVNGNQTGSTITLDDNPIPTNNGSAYAGVLYKATISKGTIKGHGEKDSLVQFERGITLHRGTLQNDAYTDSGFTTVFGNDFNEAGGSTATNLSNVILPLSFNDNNTIGNGVSGHPSRWLKRIDALPDSVGSADNGFQGDLFGVVLDRYDVEGGNRGDEILSKGTVFTYNDNTHVRKYANSITTVNMGLSTQFMTLDGPNGGARSATATDAEGIFMGFKARLNLDTSESNITRNTYKGANNKDIYFYRITSSEILDYITDLTGCYLASEVGKEFGTGTVTGATGGINNTIPDNLGYVLSHEIETDNTTLTHIIQVDVDLADGFYRIMQPNETAFYDFTPNKIKLNTLSSEYTKVAYEDKTYTTTRDYALAYGSGERDSPLSGNVGHNEAVLSMYVLVDTDAQSEFLLSSREEVVPRTHTDAYVVLADVESLYENQFSMCITDGINTHKTSINQRYLGTTQGSYIEFGEMQEKHGLVSMSETFTVTTSANILFPLKRAMIGSVVNISHEADNILNDLLETNDIEYTIPDSTYPLFLAPNFKSVDLFSAINYILKRKDKQLIYEDDKFKIKESTDTDLYPSLVISDRNQKIQIKDFKKSTGLFDFYNEIIVYGSTHVSKKRNLRSIQKVGKKTLEVEDPSIFTQEDVDEKASELLRIHSKINEKISVELGHSGLSQLRAGDTVSLELLQENVPKNQYQILEMEHRIDGFVKLELGRFSKGMEDRFAELLISTNANKAKLRSKELIQPDENVSILDLVSLKERKLLIQKRESSATTNKIGFVRTIGFSIPMGTAGITTTTVREVDF
jgi:hypothetical protein